MDPTVEFIESWANQQRRVPVPLSERLRAAVASLAEAIKNEIPDLPEPELDDTNWIGKLQEHRDRHPIAARKDLYEFSPVNGMTSNGSPRWACYVTLAEDPRPRLPQPLEDGREISFARKKDAKQYAAKCAMDWLSEHGMNGMAVQLPTPVANGIRMLNQGQPSPTPFTPPKQQHTTNGTGPIVYSPFDESQPSATMQVTRLCNALSIRQPKYMLGVPDKHGYCSGRIDFDRDNEMLPFDVSALHVEKILGVKAAREELAEMLVKCLLNLQREREEGKQAFLAGVVNPDAIAV